MTGRTYSGLYSVDISTGVATQIGKFGANNIRAGYLTAIGSTLFMTDAFSDRLYTIDVNTGRLTRVGSAFEFGARIVNATGIAFIAN